MTAQSDSSGSPRPLLLLDVDGPLNPWPLLTRTGHTAGDGWTRHKVTGLPGFPAGLPVLVSAAHGPALRALAESYTLVWATTWGEHANTHLAPLLGLSNLPVLDLPDRPPESYRRGQRRYGSWKTPHVARWLDGYAPGLAWAWVDDEVNRFDRSWFAAHYADHPHPVAHLLLRVEARRGLRPEDFTTLGDFAGTLRDAAGDHGRDHGRGA